MGRVLVIEFDDRDTSAFDEVMRILEKHPNFEQFKLKDESMLSLLSVDILLKRRKVYRGYDEIPLTTKEFDVFCMLAANKGIVRTYTQIYDKLWKEVVLGNVNNTVGCHVRSLRRKLKRLFLTRRLQYDVSGM